LKLPTDIVLLTVYSKSEQADISNAEIKRIIKTGIVNYVEILVFIHLNYKIKKSKTYLKLTMPKNIHLTVGFVNTDSHSMTVQLCDLSLCSCFCLFVCV
jgi:hypothetical protein